MHAKRPVAGHLRHAGSPWPHVRLCCSLARPAAPVFDVAGRRARGLPVVLDEVFSGLWRLGAVSAAERLGIQPDIACYAKLLTGARCGGASMNLSQGHWTCFRLSTALLHSGGLLAAPWR